MPGEQGILFGIVALQAALLESRHLSEFIDATEDWDESRDGPLTAMMVERGWIRPSDRTHLEYLVERKLQQYSGDAQASLASVAREIERSGVLLRDEKPHRSLAVHSVPQNSFSPAPGSGPHSKGAERYALTTLHATGGIGRVWLARDDQMGRDVALKELRPEQADNAVLRARFLREAQVTGQLEHPGIVPVYELARRPETGQPFYTMRFVRGRTLTEIANEYHQKRAAGKADSLEFSKLLNAFVVVCKAVAYAHTRGVIHRDLKGQNVVVGDFGEVVVLDWGLAKLVPPDADCCRGEVIVQDWGFDNRAALTDEELHTSAKNTDSQSAGKTELTMQGDTLGTPAYMSPEQAAGRLDLIERRTDVYGLGAMLYHLLTGQAPFNGGNVDEVLRKVEFEEPIPPEQFWAEVPLTLQAACLRALAKQPSVRFASANDLAQEVEQWQEVQRKRAEEALRISQALYHSLVESIPLCVWRKDREGRFTFANNAFSAAFGIKPEDMIGKTDSDFFPADLVLQILRDDNQVLTTGETLRVTEVQRTPQGPRSVEVIKIPIREPSGEIVGTQGIFWDITAWKQLDEEPL